MGVFHLQERLLFNLDTGGSVYVQVMIGLSGLKGVQEVWFYILSLVFHFFF